MYINLSTVLVHEREGLEFLNETTGRYATTIC